MAPQHHGDVRYYDAHGVEQRLDSEDLHLIDGNCQQHPIIKVILTVAVAIAILVGATVLGGVLGYLAIQLRRVF